MQFQIRSRRKTGKEVPDSSRLEFLEKLLANNFALSGAEDNTSGPLNKRSIASRFTFVENTIRTFVENTKSRDPSFWNVMDSFVL